MTGMPPLIRTLAAAALIAAAPPALPARGYAYAATDKGNSGTTFYQDGDKPGDAIAEWNRRVTQLTIAAKAAVAQRHDPPPRHRRPGQHLRTRHPLAPPRFEEDA
jgi:hypothetical protein